MNLLILTMALGILVSAILANGLKNAKDGEFEYVKDDNTIRIFFGGHLRALALGFRSDTGRFWLG